MLTCKSFRNACDEEILFKSKCFQLLPQLFILQLSPLFDPKFPSLTWKQRYLLARVYPHRLSNREHNVGLYQQNEKLIELEEKDKYEPSDICGVQSPTDEVFENGMRHQNKTSYNTNILCTTPLPSTMTKKRIRTFFPIKDEIYDKFTRKGVDYFEMRVIQNTIEWNRFEIKISRHSSLFRFSF